MPKLNSKILRNIILRIHYYLTNSNILAIFM